jgi:hypothetical protein
MGSSIKGDPKLYRPSIGPDVRRSIGEDARVMDGCATEPGSLIERVV